MTAKGLVHPFKEFASAQATNWCLGRTWEYE